MTAKSSKMLRIEPDKNAITRNTRSCISRNVTVWMPTLLHIVVCPAMIYI